MPVGRPISLERRPVSAGRRDRQVVIEQLTDSEDATGFPTEAWSTLATLWVSREDQRADERHAAHQESAYVETAWRLAYRADMDPEIVDVPKTRRINDRGRIYDIRAAALIGKAEGVVLLTMGQSG